MKPKHEECGNQVSGTVQITSETTKQILSQIECEYNSETLKRKSKRIGQGETQNDRTYELYVLGMNTLEALMLVLRLKQEWDSHVRHQY